jgi:hypothetical protein
MGLLDVEDPTCPDNPLSQLCRTPLPVTGIALLFTLLYTFYIT